MSVEELLKLGNQSLDREEPRPAIANFMQILQGDPSHVAALSGLAKATLQLNDPETAWQMVQMALALAPDDRDVLNAAGTAKLALGDPSGAAPLFEAALALGPSDPGVRLNLATARAASGDLAGAEEIYRDLKAEGRTDATVMYNHSLVQLLEGRLAEAWPGFEMRQKALNTGMRKRTLPGKPWDGSLRPNESLLVHAEQGLGDNIQFARYAPLLAERVGRVVLETPKPLRELFETLDGVDALVDVGDPLPHCLLHASVMSLPALCGTNEATIPAQVPYLSASQDAVARWAGRLGAGDGRIHVGLVWAGNAAHRRDRERSVPLAALTPVLTAGEDLTFHAFQVGDALAQIRDVPEAAGVDILFPTQEPLTEVAAALKAVDVLITVDTALAHLAGALARPVWNLITRVPDWRWMMDRGDTPWYPTMRLFRQPTAGDWESVANDVRRALRDLAKTPR